MDTKIKDASIEDLEKMKELGFDLSDVQKFGQAWIEAIQDRDKLEKIVNIIFEAPQGTYNLKVIYQGLKSFFENVGVFLI